MRAQKPRERGMTFRPCTAGRTLGRRARCHRSAVSRRGRARRGCPGCRTLFGPAARCACALAGRTQPDRLAEQAHFATISTPTRIARSRIAARGVLGAATARRTGPSGGLIGPALSTTPRLVRSSAAPVCPTVAATGIPARVLGPGMGRCRQQRKRRARNRNCQDAGSGNGPTPAPAMSWCRHDRLLRSFLRPETGPGTCAPTPDPKTT